MGKFLYFASGGGANLTEEAYVAEAENVSCIIPRTNSTTVIYFTKTDEDKDSIVLTHDNTTATTGHRCKDIARAIATAANSTPHGTMVDIVDLDNNVFFGNLNFITSMTITLNG